MGSCGVIKVGSVLMAFELHEAKKYCVGRCSQKNMCVYIVCTFPVNVQQWHDQNIFTISNGKYIWFYKFVKLSFIGGEIWNEDEKCWKLVIEVVISWQRNKMSIQKWCFSDFNNKNWCFSDFSLNKIYVCINTCTYVAPIVILTNEYVFYI